MPMAIGSNDALLQEYAQVAQDFRTLTDIRFRLLGLLPVVSGAAVALAVYKGDVANVQTVGIALFGLSSALGACAYNARNTQLYDELVGRAAQIERLAGLTDGHFATRPKPWLKFEFGLEVEHGWALALIYGTSIALWLSLLFAALFELLRRGYLALNFPHCFVDNPGTWTSAIAVGSAILVTRAGWKRIAAAIKLHEDTLRAKVVEAYQHARSLYDSIDFTDTTLISLCASINTLKARLKNAPQPLPDPDPNGEAIAVVQARAKYLQEASTTTWRQFVPLESEQNWASHCVAFLTDLPPRWIVDSGEDRRGEVAAADWRANSRAKSK
jgi:hypothetical protein